MQTRSSYTKDLFATYGDQLCGDAPYCRICHR